MIDVVESPEKNTTQKAIERASSRLKNQYQNILHIAGMLADIGGLNCLVVKVKPKGIIKKCFDFKAKKRTADLRHDIDSAAEHIVELADAVGDELRSILGDLDQARLHAPDTQTQHGVEAAIEEVRQLLHSTTELKFYNMMVKSSHTPNLPEIYQAGIKEYDKSHS